MTNFILVTASFPRKAFPFWTPDSKGKSPGNEVALIIVITVVVVVVVVVSSLWLPEILLWKFDPIIPKNFPE